MTSTDPDSVDHIQGSGNPNKNCQRDYNIFRDSLLRYAGYANEVGESFRYQFPRLVIPSYILSFGYCFADATNTAYSTYQKSQQQQGFDIQTDKNKSLQHASICAFDTLLWQSLASVMIPGVTINLIVKTVRNSILPRSFVSLPVAVVSWLPTAIGLLSIPLIIHPIDKSVDFLLDNTTRKYMKI